MNTGNMIQDEKAEITARASEPASNGDILFFFQISCVVKKRGFLSCFLLIEIKHSVFPSCEVPIKESHLRSQLQALRELHEAAYLWAASGYFWTIVVECAY